jgi:hypothetical protein
MRISSKQLSKSIGLQDGGVAMVDCPDNVCGYMVDFLVCYSVVLAG